MKKCIFNRLMLGIAIFLIGLASPASTTDAKCNVNASQLDTIRSGRMDWAVNQPKNRCKLMSDVSQPGNETDRCGSIWATARSDVINEKAIKEITNKVVGPDNTCPLIFGIPN